MVKNSKTKKTTEQIIADIHNDFDSASERLLQGAKEIVIADNNKGDRLKRIGFSNAKPVKEVEELREAQHKNQELAERVAYFSQWYPHNKFITEEAVQGICEKYGLVFASAEYYKGDVPEKNLLEMEHFVLRKEDMIQDVFSDFAGYFRRRLMMGVDWSIGGMPPRFVSDESPSEDDHFSKPPFKICAPEKDFDTSNLTKKGYKLELNIPDPIVLQPVRGGCLIVTKWGLEASDEMVVNNKAN
jgi:hypothetical protein